jgi:hypothetical protein
MTALRRNEEKRWSYMTEPQLWKRLDKITNPKKLSLFAELAKKYDCRKLRREALDKLRFFTELEVK